MSFSNEELEMIKKDINTIGEYILSIQKNVREKESIFAQDFSRKHTVEMFLDSRNFYLKPSESFNTVYYIVLENKIADIKIDQDSAEAFLLVIANWKRLKAEIANRLKEQQEELDTIKNFEV